MIAFFSRHFPSIQPEIPSMWRINEKLEKLSGIHPQWFDCCINSCMAYTGLYKDKLSCDYCNTPRFYDRKDTKGHQKPKKRYLFLPLCPRLRAQYKTEQAQVLMEYRASFDNRQGGADYTDIFDGKLYQHWLREKLGLFQRYVAIYSFTSLV